MLPSRYCGPCKGFTLVELLIVLILVGLLSSMVAVSVSSGLFKSRERRFVEDFMAQMKRARSGAIGRGRAINFVVDGDKRKFGIKDRRMMEIPRAIEISADGLVELGNGLFAVTFYPDGSSSGGEIDLSWDNGRKDNFHIGMIWANIEHEVENP